MMNKYKNILENILENVLENILENKNILYNNLKYFFMNLSKT